ncbi:MAG: protein-methionine-sulfoxide reductase catalytic subunit MsrP [Blastocatellia bacterium]
MFIRKPDDITSSEITSESAYRNRRTFIRSAVMAGTALASAGLYRGLSQPSSVAPAPESEPASGLIEGPDGESATTFDDITTYNNFYEFSTDKRGVAENARGFVTEPWTVTVSGLCARPTTFDLDSLSKLATPEDRVYRMRCVERWSMVIPWLGIPLSALLNAVEPLSTAKYVAFVTLLDPERMPNQRTSVLDWPYVEGLRMDEAMHPLTILATGLYGRPLLPQNGAPLRLVVPWKYGFKGIKSIVSIKLVEGEPPATWNRSQPNEYGFYANVNPKVDHPRWSQAKERRIGEFGQRDTLLFNGYAEQVASLYAGMDLRRYF